MYKFYKINWLFLFLTGCAIFNLSNDNDYIALSNYAGEFINGTYKSDDESYLKIHFESGGLVMQQAENDYAPDCSLVKPLYFNQIAPNIYLWSKDKCQMTITTLTQSDKIVLTVNKLERCFDQYDIDQPFSCFGRPMMEQQGLYIVGKMYKFDTNPDDQI